MSKQSEAKKEQGYVEKAIPKQCATCAHYRSDMADLPPSWSGTIYREEKNRRCGLSGFAVKKTATCTKHEFEPSPFP